LRVTDFKILQIKLRNVS